MTEPDNEERLKEALASAENRIGADQQEIGRLTDELAATKKREVALLMRMSVIEQMSVGRIKCDAQKSLEDNRRQKINEQARQRYEQAWKDRTNGTFYGPPWHVLSEKQRDKWRREVEHRGRQ